MSEVIKHVVMMKLPQNIFNTMQADLEEEESWLTVLINVYYVVFKCLSMEVFWAGREASMMPAGRGAILWERWMPAPCGASCGDFAWIIAISFCLSKSTESNSGEAADNRASRTCLQFNI